MSLPPSLWVREWTRADAQWEIGVARLFRWCSRHIIRCLLVLNMGLIFKAQFGCFAHPMGHNLTGEALAHLFQVVYASSKLLIWICLKWCCVFLWINHHLGMMFLLPRWPRQIQEEIKSTIGQSLMIHQWLFINDLLASGLPCPIRHKSEDRITWPQPRSSADGANWGKTHCEVAAVAVDRRPMAKTSAAIRWSKLVAPVDDGHQVQGAVMCRISPGSTRSRFW